jgi:hypothetical protein
MFRHAEALGRLGDKSREGIVDISLARCKAGNARWACAEALNSIDDARIATINSIALRARKAAIVLTVRGKR